MKIRHIFNNKNKETKLKNQRLSILFEQLNSIEKQKEELTKKNRKNFIIILLVICIMYFFLISIICFIVQNMQKLNIDILNMFLSFISLIASMLVFIFSTENTIKTFNLDHEQVFNGQIISIKTEIFNIGSDLYIKNQLTDSNKTNFEIKILKIQVPNDIT